MLVSMASFFTASEMASSPLCSAEEATPNERDLGEFGGGVQHLLVLPATSRKKRLVRLSNRGLVAVL